MRNSRAFLDAGFGRADVEVAIDLHRINADDFSPKPRRDLHGQKRFAAGRGTEDDEDGRLGHQGKIQNEKFKIASGRRRNSSNFEFLILHCVAR
jgi:hypothetical protein